MGKRIFFLATALLAALAAPVRAEPRDPPLSEAAQKAFDAWQAQYSEAKAGAREAMQPTPLARLHARVSVEQAGRRALMSVNAAGLSEADTKAATAAIWAVLTPADADNTAFLKTILPADGWFRISREGYSATIDGWVVVQHSPDRAFMREVLARMEPLMAERDVDGQTYALLFDRVAVFEGRRQRFGTQGACENGKIAILAIEEPDAVEARRKELGMLSLTDYERQIGVGNRC